MWAALWRCVAVCDTTTYLTRFAHPRMPISSYFSRVPLQFNLRFCSACRLSVRPSVLCLVPCRSGRLVDHLENTKGFNLRSVKYLILDEADRMLSMDFEEEINQILEVIPRSRTTFLFSATMTTKVAKLQRAAMRDPVKVQVNSKYQTVKTLIQRCVSPSIFTL